MGKQKRDKKAVTKWDLSIKLLLLKPAGTFWRPMSYLALSYLEYELLSTVGEGTGVLIYQIWLRAIP